jgi:hypothetical protein
MAAVTTPGQSLVFSAVSGGIIDDYCDRQLIEIRYKNAVITGFFKQSAAGKTAVNLDMDQGFQTQPD